MYKIINIFIVCLKFECNFKVKLKKSNQLGMHKVQVMLFRIKDIKSQWLDLIFFFWLETQNYKGLGQMSISHLPHWKNYLTLTFNLFILVRYTTSLMNLFFFFALPFDNSPQLKPIVYWYKSFNPSVWCPSVPNQ